MSDFLANRPVLRQLMATPGVKTAGKPIKYISPSHLSLFEMCPRRWYFQYIMGVKPPSGTGAEFGQRAHSHIDKYLTEGVPVPWDQDDGAAALAGIDHWPNRDDVHKGFVLVEKEILVHRNALPVPYYGVVDLLRVDEAAVDDHKFSSDPAKWGATAEQLKYDFQGIIYSAGALSIGARPRVDKRTGKQYVRFGHLQYRSRAPYKCLPVQVEMPVDHVQKELDALDSIVVEMFKVGQIARPEDTPYKEGANSCDKYGREGCFFREICSAAGVEKAIQDPVAKAMARINYGGQDMASPLDKLKKAQAAAAGTPINPPDGFPASEPIPPKDLRVAEPNESAAAEGERIEQEKAAAKEAARAQKEADKASAKASRPGAVMLPGRGSKAADVAQAAVKTEAQPEKPAAVVEASSTAHAYTEQEKAELDQAIAAVKAAELKVEECEALLEEANNGDDDDEKAQAASNAAFYAKKLVKVQDVLKSVELKIAESAEKRAVAARETEAAAKKAAAEKAAATVVTATLQKASATFAKEGAPLQVVEVDNVVVDGAFNFLYLNCRPRRANAVMWEDFIAPITKRIEAATNTPFWRLRGHDAQATLVQEMRVMLAEGALVLPQHLAIEPYGGNHVQVAEFLIPLYSEVISA